MGENYAEGIQNISAKDRLRIHKKVTKGLVYFR
jgi:hypothetical protein